MALKGSPNPDWPFTLVLEQIKSKNKARTKIPQWLESAKPLLFPPSDIIEQASSNATAYYKASLVQAENIVDLCAGCGVDTLALLQQSKQGIIVDYDPLNAFLLEHNLTALSPTPVHVKNRMAEDFVKDMNPCDLVYADPQRRTKDKKGLRSLSDCSPNILEILGNLKRKTKYLMLKTSPMLDISTAIKELSHITSVHIIEHDGDCKEVIYIIDFQTTELPPENIPIHAVKLEKDGHTQQKFSYTKSDESKAIASYENPKKYLFEPGPALMKSGAFNSISETYGMPKLHKSTHLYTTDQITPDIHRALPGRFFEITDIYAVNRRALPLQKANLTIRNFPGTVESLRKKLKLKEGGNDYLFACTMPDNSKALIHGHKV